MIEEKRQDAPSSDPVMQDNDEAPVPRARKPPPGPAVEELDKHELTHVVFRSDALQHVRIGHQRSCWIGCSSQVIKSRVFACVSCLRSFHWCGNGNAVNEAFVC